MKYSFTLILSFLLMTLSAQDAEVIKSVFDQMSAVGTHEGVPYYAVNSSTGNKVSGSEYLQEDFTEGFVMTPEKEVYRLRARYDAYNDEIQFINQKKELKALLPQRIKAVALGKQIFVPALTKSKKGEMNWAYFELLSEGKMLLLKRHEAVAQTVQSHPVLGTVNNEYKVVIREKLYYGKAKQMVQPIKKGRKAILKLLSDEKEAISQFVKHKKLSYKKEADLVKIFSYYNQLKLEAKS